MHIPIQTNLPRLDQLTVAWHGRHFSLPYFYRDGTGGPAILFVHGLGGAKENFYAAFQSPALADCTLATFDQPGTGLAAFDPNAGLDVTALADMAQTPPSTPPNAPSYGGLALIPAAFVLLSQSD